MAPPVSEEGRGGLNPGERALGPLDSDLRARADRDFVLALQDAPAGIWPGAGLTPPAGARSVHALGPGTVQTLNPVDANPPALVAEVDEQVRAAVGQRIAALPDETQAALNVGSGVPARADASGRIDLSGADWAAVDWPNLPLGAVDRDALSPAQAAEFDAFAGIRMASDIVRTVSLNGADLTISAEDGARLTLNPRADDRQGRIVDLEPERGNGGGWVEAQRRLWGGAPEAWNAAVLAALPEDETPQAGPNGLFLPPDGFPGFPAGLSAAEREDALRRIFNL